MLQRVALVVVLSLAVTCAMAEEDTMAINLQQEQGTATDAPSFIEVERDGMRKKAGQMADEFVTRMRDGLKAVYPGKGALKAAALSHSADFEGQFRRNCRIHSPSAKMCPNFMTLYRLSFADANPFSAENRPRFVDACKDVILRWVSAWRQRHPKRSLKAGGNPWSPALNAPNADPMADVRVHTAVRGGLNRFGRLNVMESESSEALGIRPKGEYPVGSAVDDALYRPYKAHKHVKQLREQVLKDLRVLREAVYQKIKEKKFNRMIGNRDKAPRAIQVTALTCKALRKSHFFPPTFCRSVEYIASVNFVGRNYFAKLKDFSALVASFMDHNHKIMTRYGFHVVRRPNYRQDVTVIRAKFALRLRATKFNLRTLSREFTNILSNVMGVSERRLRVAGLQLGGRYRDHKRRLRTRKYTTITWEFLPRKSDKRIRSRPDQPGSVDALAEQFYALVQNKPQSDVYKVPILSRVVKNSLVMSKTLGRRRNYGKPSFQSVNPAPARFSAVSTASDAVQSAVVEEQSEAEAAAALEAAHNDAETVELESSDEEYTEAEDEELEEALQAIDEEEEEEVEEEEEEQQTSESAESDSESEAEAETETESEQSEEAEGAAAEEQEEVESAPALVETGAATATAAAPANNELGMSLLDVADHAQDLHTQRTETEAEAEDEESVEVDESEAEADAAAADAIAEVDASEAESAESEELSSDDWNTALMQQTEQLVAEEEEAEEEDSEDSAEGEAEADSEDAADSEDSDSAEAEEDLSADSKAGDANAPIAPPEVLAPLPEVNAKPDTAQELAQAAAANDKAEAANEDVVLLDLGVTSGSSRAAPLSAVVIGLVALIAALL